VIAVSSGVSWLLGPLIAGAGGRLDLLLRARSARLGPDHGILTACRLRLGEVVRTSRLVAGVEGNFSELTLEVGRRLPLDDVVVVEWTCDYGDGGLYRNVTMGELEDGQVVRVTDYWSEPTVTPEWRQALTDRLDMPGNGIWPDAEHLGHYWCSRPRP
jgi:hypothetical protein